MLKPVNQTDCSTSDKELAYADASTHKEEDLQNTYKDQRIVKGGFLVPSELGITLF